MQENKENKKFSPTIIAKIAMLSAAASILLFIEFPIFPATPWLRLNVSDAPALIASFMFGPLAGVVVNAVKIGICLLIRGTSTAFVGDLSNLVSGSLYAIVAGVVYILKKDKLGAIIALISSGAVFCASMWLFNQFILLPFYNMTEQSVLIPALWWTLLFNVIKVTLTGILTFFLYKTISKLLNSF